MRSENFITARMTCSIMMTATPCSFSPKRSARMSSTSEAESPAMASSEMRSLGFAAIARARRVVERNAEIVEHRHAAEGFGYLEAARKAEARAPVRGMPADVLTLEPNAAFLVRQRPGDAVDERALARAVRADETDALARTHQEVDLFERCEAPEALRDAANLEQRLGHQCPFRRRHASTHPMMPFGASVTKSTSSAPTMRRFQADETVTCTSCCTVPRRTAPISGPIQLIMPPISGMAMLLTAYDRLNAELGST